MPTMPASSMRARLAAPPFGHDPNLNHPQQPVVAVSWFEAVRYCEWLSATTGRKFRLPTEAEWERAARGGREGELYPWGNTTPQALPDYAERCARYWKAGPEPVGLRRSQRIWPLQHVRQRARMVQRLVFGRTTMQFRRSAIRAGRRRANGEPPVEGRGGITLKCRAAPRDRVSRPSFNMPTTGSESRATDEVRSPKSIEDVESHRRVVLLPQFDF